MAIFWDQLAPRLYALKQKICGNPLNAMPVYRREFESFDRQILQKTNKKNDSYFDLRCYEIEKYIRKCNVQSVIEMGSGRTTFVLNLFPLNVVSIEQDPSWVDLMHEVLAKTGIAADIFQSEVIECKGGAKFKSYPDSILDMKGSRTMLYIDGPYFLLAKKNSSIGGKAAYFDFESVIESIGMPDVIMIEGRYATVEAILNSEYSRFYKFQGEYGWCRKVFNWIGVFRLQRHSIFLLKDRMYPRASCRRV